MEHKTEKRPKPKIARTADYNCAYVMVMAILIIFPLILKTVISLVMLYKPQAIASVFMWIFDLILQ